MQCSLQHTTQLKVCRIFPGHGNTMQSIFIPRQSKSQHKKLSSNIVHHRRSKGDVHLMTDMYQQAYKLYNWLVVSAHLKNISQIGNLPQIGVKIKNVWNHHLDNCQFNRSIGHVTFQSSPTSTNAKWPWHWFRVSRPSLASRHPWTALLLSPVPKDCQKGTVSPFHHVSHWM